MTTSELIEELKKQPPTAEVGIYNPVFGETIYLAKLECTNNFVELLFDEEPKTGHPFAP